MISADLFLFRSALRDATRPRRLLGTLLLVFLPAALGLAGRLLTPQADWAPEDLYDTLVPLLIFSFSLTILSVVYGTGVVGQEIEQKTIVYLLTRPIKRWRILIARFAVSLLVVMATTTLSLLLLALALFGPSQFASAGVGPDLRALALGTLAYGALFLLLGALSPRPLIYGLLFVFGWETWVPRLPGAFAKISIMSYLRALAAREIAPAASSNNDNGGLGFLQTLGSAPQTVIPTSLAWTVLGAVTAVSLLTALVVFSRREYAPREDVE